MEFQVAFSPQAWRDLEEIRRFIAADNPEGADAFVERLAREAINLKLLPLRGAQIQNRSSRILIVGSYLVVYHVNQAKRQVRIQRFWHAARDIGRLRP